MVQTLRIRGLVARLPLLVVALLIGVLGVVAMAQPVGAAVPDPERYLPRAMSWARVPVAVGVTREPGGVPFASYGGTNFWVSLGERTEVAGVFYRWGTWGWGQAGWFKETDLRFDQALSRLQGIDLTLEPMESAAVVMLDPLNIRGGPGTTNPIVGRATKWDQFPVFQEASAGGTNWLRIGENRWIAADFVRRLRPGQRPEGIPARANWVEVDLASQTVYAHRGDTPVYATVTATGRGNFDTPRGIFQVYQRQLTGPMAWLETDPPYSYGEVPYIQYFSGSYGLHMAYWHDAYGAVRSAGCVNLSPADAKWFWDFGANGMYVWVR